MFVAKKRYAGYNYETPSSTPFIESKGLENIRRDFNGLINKSMEYILEQLFKNWYSKPKDEIYNSINS